MFYFQSINNYYWLYLQSISSFHHFSPPVCPLPRSKLPLSVLDGYNSFLPGLPTSFLCFQSVLNKASHIPSPLASHHTQRKPQLHSYKTWFPPSSLFRSDLLFSATQAENSGRLHLVLTGTGLDSSIKRWNELLGQAKTSNGNVEATRVQSYFILAFGGPSWA